MAIVPSTTPPAVHQSLVKLGADLNASRRRWRLPLSEVAARAGTCRQTISRIERGDPLVAMGTWASVLHTLRLLDRLTDLASPASKLHAGMIAIEHLPTRVRPSKRYGT
jgi:DNA-binding XRE family transcriptional regulator